jgi:signal peptidase I
MQEQPRDPRWVPKRWLAVLLSFIGPGLGFVYLTRWKTGLAYFSAAFAIGLAELWIATNAVSFSLREHLAGSSAAFVVTVVCMIHTFFAAKRINFSAGRPWYSRWYVLVAVPLSAVMSLLLVRAFLYEPFHQPSASMEPTLRTNELFLVQKWGYGNYGTYGVEVITTASTVSTQAGDIVVVKSPQNPKTWFVKRVIGLPGDRLSYLSNQLVVNGREAFRALPTETERIEETIGDKSWFIQSSKDLRQIDLQDVTVPAGHYFVMGDNRNNSMDSRSWGFVPSDHVIGKLVLILPLRY